MSDVYDSPTRRSNRISGRNPIDDIDLDKVSTSKELKSLLSSGGSGGKLTSTDDSWTFFSSDKVKKRVYPTLRLVYSWVLDEKKIQKMTNKDVLFELIIYMQTDHQDFYNECMSRYKK